MLAMLKEKSRGTLSKHTRRLWMTFMVVLTMATAAIAVGTAGAQASSSSETFPKTVLMKDNTELQNGRFIYGTWHYYEAGSWNTVFADGFYGFPPSDVVRAGSTLHIRIDKPQRPENFTITAYPRLDENGMSGDGERQRLATTLRRVERDGKTVAWDAYFRLKRPDRHYYLGAFGVWKGSRGSSDAYWQFHVKTGP